MTAAILAQEPQAAPETLKKSPAPLFHAASRKIRRELYEAYKYFLAAFRDDDASRRARCRLSVWKLPSGRAVGGQIECGPLPLAHLQLSCAPRDRGMGEVSSLNAPKKGRRRPAVPLVGSIQPDPSLLGVPTA
jgi:hypothetical protein